VPVMEGDTLIGVISIRDVLARPEADRQERHGPLPGTEPSHLHQ
jgi:CBS domain-containing protein